MPEPRGTSQKNVVSFNSGEWSPFLDSRADNQKYDNACRELTNVTLLPYGGAERRGGLEYVAATKDSGSSRCRLIGFNFSTTTTYIIELGNDGTGYMRFFSNGAPVTRLGSVDSVLSSGTPPWSASEVSEVQFIQINDVLYMTHPNHPVQKLSRIASDEFKIETVVFDKPAFKDINTTDTTLSSSVTAVAATGTLTASASTFNANHVGSYWKLVHKRDAAQVDLTLTATGISTELQVQGEWNLRTTGNWAGTVQLERFNDAISGWEVIREFVSNDGDRNVDVVDEQDEEERFRINYTGATASSGSANPPHCYLEIVDQDREGIVRIDSFTNATSVGITVIDQVESTDNTDLWAEGAWSDSAGYPRSVAVFEQRVVYGGTSSQPQTVWGSVTGDFENMKAGTSDDDGFSYTLASSEQNTIQWLSGQNKLLIGTIGAEYIMGGDGEKPLTPSNVAVFRQSTYGSAFVQSKVVGDSVFYVQRNGRKVREMVESETSITAKYVSPDLTVFSEHITEGGITESFFTQQPHVIFWGVTGNGKLIGMTFEREQNVIGWFKFETPGASGVIESAASIYGGLNDELWCVVKRNIGGSDVRYIEKISTNVIYGYSGSGSVNSQLTDKDYSFYVDSGVWYDGVATGTVTGLDHLEGETVKILADGDVFPDQTVSGGQITLPDSQTGEKIAVGLGYDSVIKPMKLEADARIGSTVSTVKKIRRADVSFYKSLGVLWAANWDEDDSGTVNFQRFPMRDTGDLMDSSPPLFTGTKEIQLLSRHDKEGNLTIKQSDPLPMTILKIVYKYEVTGR